MNAQYEAAWLHALESVEDIGPMVATTTKLDYFRYRSSGLPSGFQSVGFGQDPRDPSRLYQGHYGGQAAVGLHTVRVSDTEIELKRFEPHGFIGRANLAGDSTEWVRLIPEILDGSDAKRPQDFVMRPNGDIWFTQNTSRSRIYRMHQDPTARFGWRLLAPIELSGDTNDYIESFTVDNETDTILVWRADRNKGPGHLVAYNFSGDVVGHTHTFPVGAGYYMGEMLKGTPTFITSPGYYKGKVPGILRGDQLIAPGVVGTDVAFPYGNDGGALVLLYGEGLGKLGQPTLHVYVPQSMFLPHGG